MFYHGYIWAVLMALDQLGNALAGGHPDVSVSARLGYLSARRIVRTRHWCWLEAVVDWAFYPAEGTGHCFRSWIYLHDTGDNAKVRRGNDAGLLVLLLLVLGAAVPLRAVNTIRGRS